jgi:hypothetical protein
VEPNHLSIFGYFESFVSGFATNVEPKQAMENSVVSVALPFKTHSISHSPNLNVLKEIHNNVGYRL